MSLCIATAENCDMELYRELMNNFSSVYIANNFFLFIRDNFSFQSPYCSIFRGAELWLLCGYSAL